MPDTSDIAAVNPNLAAADLDWRTRTHKVDTLTMPGAGRAARIFRVHKGGCAMAEEKKKSCGCGCKGGAKKDEGKKAAPAPKKK